MAGIELEFLTDDESAREVCRQYWQVGDDGGFIHPVSRIAEVFNIPRHSVTSRVATTCRAFSRDDCCASCGTPRPFTSRTDYTQRRHYGGWTSWTCQECREAQQAETRRENERRAALRRSLLQDELDQKRRPGLSHDRLSFTDAVYLVSLLRIGGSEDLSFIAPYESFTTPLSPTSDFDREILDYLYRRGIICIHPGSRQESIVIEDNAFTKFFPFKVHWTLPLPEGGPSPARFLEDLEELLKSEEWPADWYAASAELHRTVALQECLQYLRVVMKEHGFEPRLGEKTLLVIKSVLGKFSIGQVYNFMWRAARDAAAFYVREGTSKAHAANIVPGSVQRMAERALAEGWQVKPYRRDFRAPQSQLSQVLFTVVLQLPEGGLTTTPPPPEENEEAEGNDGAQENEDRENE